MYRQKSKAREKKSRAAAKTQSGSDGVQRVLGFLDNRGLSPDFPSNVAQRMAVMAAKDWQAQEDTLVWNNLRYAQKEAGGPIGDLLSHRVWNQLKDMEEIRIVEHGEVGGLGKKNTEESYKAGDIADSMFAPSTGVPKGMKIGKVTFQSCYAGAGGKSSLVNTMASELGKHGREGVAVEGRTGIAFGFEGMGEETAKTSKWPTYKWRNKQAKKEFLSRGYTFFEEKGLKAYLDSMFTLQNEETQTTNERIFKDLWDYNDPWILVGKSRPEWEKLNAADRGKMVAFQMEKYWEKLVILMGSLGGFKPPKGAIKKVISKK